MGLLVERNVHPSADDLGLQDFMRVTTSRARFTGVSMYFDVGQPQVAGALMDEGSFHGVMHRCTVCGITIKRGYVPYPPVGVPWEE
jgi:hypothetical protein